MVIDEQRIFWDGGPIFESTPDTGDGRDAGDQDNGGESGAPTEGE